MSNPYEFAGSLYMTADARNLAKCQSYLSADGNNSAETIIDFFDEYTDKELAKDMLYHWPDKFMTIDDVAAIFAELRNDQSWLDD